MPTSDLGNDAGTRRAKGFTLIELLIVLLIAACASGMVILSMAQLNERHLQSEALRLIAKLEGAKALARHSERVVTFGLDPQGFYLQGLPEEPLRTWHTDWLYAATRATLEPNPMALGPEALMASAHIELFDSDHPERHLSIASDGLRAFHIQAP